MKNYPEILKNYKRQAKTLQRRIQIEKDVNRRLSLLLAQCESSVSDGLLKKMIAQELKMLKYRYAI